MTEPINNAEPYNNITVRMAVDTETQTQFVMNKRTAHLIQAIGATQCSSLSRDVLKALKSQSQVNADTQAPGLSQHGSDPEQGCRCYNSATLYAIRTLLSKGSASTPSNLLGFCRFQNKLVYKDHCEDLIMDGLNGQEIFIIK